MSICVYIFKKYILKTFSLKKHLREDALKNAQYILNKVNLTWVISASKK